MSQYEINGIYLSGMMKRAVSNSIKDIKMWINTRDYHHRNDYIAPILLLLDEIQDDDLSLQLKSWLFIYNDCYSLKELNVDNRILIEYISKNFEAYKQHLMPEHLITFMPYCDDLVCHIDEFNLSNLSFDQLMPIIPIIHEDKIDELFIRDKFSVANYSSFFNIMPNKKNSYLEMLSKRMDKITLIELLKYTYKEQNWSIFNQVIDNIKKSIKVGIDDGYIQIINSYLEMLFVDHFLFLLDEEHLKQIQDIFMPYKETLKSKKGETPIYLDCLCKIENHINNDELIKENAIAYLFSIRNQKSSFLYNQYTVRLLMLDPILCSYFSIDPKSFILFICGYIEEIKTMTSSFNNDHVNHQLISFLENPYHGFKDQFIATYISLLNLDYEDDIAEKMIHSLLTIANMPEVITNRETAQLLNIDFDWFDRQNLNRTLNQELIFHDII